MKQKHYSPLILWHHKIYIRDALCINDLNISDEDVRFLLRNVGDMFDLMNVLFLPIACEQSGGGGESDSEDANENESNTSRISGQDDAMMYELKRTKGDPWKRCVIRG